MEALTRMVADSLARHGFDRPVDPRRLQWSRWFRCDSPHSLLVVPSKPGIFALAEEVMDLVPSKASEAGNAHVGTDAFVRPAEQSSASASAASTSNGNTSDGTQTREGHDFSRATKPFKTQPALSAEPTRRMLAVLQFSEDDDMAFTLDRMFTRANPMRARFASGRCFLRFVVIEDQSQRRSICAALNQWMLSSAEKASGIGTDFQSSLELTVARVGRTLPSAGSGQAMSDKADTIKSSVTTMPSTGSTFIQAVSELSLPHVDSGANKNLHCPHPLPSGF